MPSIEDLEPGDIVEFTDVKFGVGIFIRTIQRRKGDKHIDIELELSLGRKITIREDMIRWDKTLSHKEQSVDRQTDVLYPPRPVVSFSHHKEQPVDRQTTLDI